jgi:hypothetical protein
VILVAQALSPVGGSHETRVHHLVLEVLGRGGEAAVIAPAIGARYPQRQPEREYPGVRVRRTFPGLVHAVAHGHRHEVASRPAAPAAAPGAAPGAAASFRAALLAAVTRGYEAVAVPDSYMDWVPHAALALLGELRPGAVVVSSAMPNSAHVAVLAARAVRSFRWIADFGDPWNLDRSRPRRGLRLAIDARLERAVIERCDAATFTTEATLGDYRAAYPAHAHKMHLVRMGYDPLDAAVAGPAPVRRRVFYGGSVGPENRSIAELLEAARLLPDVEFAFAGSCVPVVERHYGPNRPANVTLEPWLAHREYVAFARGSGVNVVLGNRNPQQVPGKVYQLIGLSNRVLYVAELEADRDEAWRLLAPYAVRAANRREDIAAAVRRLLERDEAHAPPPALTWAEQMRVVAGLVAPPPAQGAAAAAPARGPA